VTLSLSPQKHFHGFCLNGREQTVLGENAAANTAQPVATAVNDRIACRTVSFARSNTGAGEGAPGFTRDRQGPVPGAIVPSKIQGCCTHNFFGHQNTTGDEWFHNNFAMLGNERGTHPLLSPWPHGYGLKEKAWGDAKTP